MKRIDLSGYGKRITAMVCVAVLLLSQTACGSSEKNEPSASSSAVSAGAAEGNAPAEKEEPVLRYQTMSAEEITDSLTLSQRAAQMVQPACYNITDEQMKENCYGSVLSKEAPRHYDEWQDYIMGLQKQAVASEAGVPFVYGQDDVHGVNFCVGAVYFPHNIGLGAADNEELMQKMGEITADEAKLCDMLWNFSPVVAQSVDPRWGRTYESLGSDIERIKKLSTAYTKGMLDKGLIVCAKHYFADGNVKFGTGEDSDVKRLIDRGDATLTDEEIEELCSVYQTLIEAGIQTIMISHSSVNGVKMHENKKYIDKLKNEMGFKGFIVSDWDSIQNTSPSSYYEQVVTAINAGIDMLMEPERFDEAKDCIVQAVEAGDIPEERVKDAVRRILQVKIDAGIMADPFFTNLQTEQTETGSDTYRETAEELVRESLVLVKNKNHTIPLKKGQKVCVVGPAAHNDRAQCGGWTIEWNESPEEDIEGVTSILEGFEKVAADYGVELTDDMSKADVVVLCVGEKAYAEWNGDAKNIDLCGDLGLEGNKEAIDEVRASGKPVITCLIAGRHIFIDKYIADWDSVVMCYLPGSEGQGIARMLCGEQTFTGKLPSNWYASVKGIESGHAWKKTGYGLSS